MVVTAVEGVDGGEAEVVVEQVGHGAAVEPGAVKIPLAAGGEQTVCDEGFEHLAPRRAWLLKIFIGKLRSVILFDTLFQVIEHGDIVLVK